MGVSLGGHGGHIAMSWGGFNELLELAYANGWKPMGTEAPMLHYNDGRVERAKDWDGSYSRYNAYQIVTAEDATNIAAALEKAWDDIPDDPHGWKNYVGEFIGLCRGGSFHIG